MIDNSNLKDLKFLYVPYKLKEFKNKLKKRDVILLKRTETNINYNIEKIILKKK